MLKDARKGRCYRDFPVLRRLFLLAAFAALASAGWASSLLASRAAHAAKIPDDATSAAATSTAAATLVFTGHGWGHGIGMSQWGAYGYALHGWTYDGILTHYY